MKRKLGGKPAKPDRNDAALQRYKLQQVTRESGGSVHEEFAAEAGIYPPSGAPVSVRERTEDRAVRTTSEGQAPERSGTAYRWLGLTAIVLAVLSLFAFPALLGSTAAVLGLFAYSVGQRALGGWALAIGLISLAGYFILVPLYA